MSSISDSWYGFAQNEKKVEVYSAAISEGRTPVLRGHILDDEDLLLRRHILNLMCRFETTWSEDDLAVPAFSEGLSRLDEMAADGLVEFGSNVLRILPAGRAFIRNVCMVLDARLWRHQPDSRIFSQVI
jgi:oxygen-independent coproporphyrinogen-3 oxidase